MARSESNGRTPPPFDFAQGGLRGRGPTFLDVVIFSKCGAAATDKMWH